jgi:hypothetical protein
VLPAVDGTPLVHESANFFNDILLSSRDWRTLDRNRTEMEEGEARLRITDGKEV